MKKRKFVSQYIDQEIYLQKYILHFLRVFKHLIQDLNSRVIAEYRICKQ